MFFMGSITVSMIELSCERVLFDGKNVDASRNVWDEDVLSVDTVELMMYLNLSILMIFCIGNAGV